MVANRPGGIGYEGSPIIEQDSSHTGDVGTSPSPIWDREQVGMDFFESSAKDRKQAHTERTPETACATPSCLQQIWEWNKTVPASIDRCVHEIILERTQLHPSAPAVCAWDGDFTYGELSHLATILATQLIRLEIGQGSIVPLCFEKSKWTTVAMLGVLKAGAAFVLLDATLPEKRLQTISQQVKAETVISSVSKEQLSLRLASRVITLESLSAAPLDEPTSLQQPASPSPSSTMYIVFTSGSTGTPKGTMITHQNLASALYHQEKSLKFNAESRVYDFCSYGFDVSICNTFATLFVGGCICVPKDEDRRDRLAESISSLRANAIDLTPSVSRLLPPDQVPGLRKIIFGGEALRVEDVRPWWGRVDIVSLYGPCECTPNSTINSNPSSPEETTHMGKGVGLVTWIVDSENHNSLLPLGSVGELLLEGPLVGRGYLNNAERTALVFIEDPPWLVKGAPGKPGRHGRLYKTGDLVRYNKDGSLSFVNRKDGQVKIRGQRVELGEIEHVLRSHPNVSNAVAVTQHGNEEEKWIAGFVTMDYDDLKMEKQSTTKTEELQHVQGWKTQFNTEYVPLDGIQSESLGRDFMGWTSMYDGSDIDKAQMQEWLDDTITALQNGGQPSHVLEIGTGSGMMLFNLSKGLKSYIGLEPSKNAVDFITKAVKSVPALADKVKMYNATATDLSGLDAAIYADIAVLNSVIQYFPSQNHLLGVIQELTQLEGIKTLFFGDVRSFALHRQFLAARSLIIAREKTSKKDVRNIMADLERAESELLVDPGFFIALPTRLPNIEHVEILPKKMNATNELSAYRYAAVIHVKVQGIPEKKIHKVDEDKWIDFAEQRLNRQSLFQLLRQHPAPSVVAVSNIPHNKSIFERHLVYALDDPQDSDTEDEDWLLSVRKRAQQHFSMSATQLIELAAQAGCRVELSWSRQFSQHGGLDAVFHHYGSMTSKERVLFQFPDDHHDPRMLCSTPLQQQWRQRNQHELFEILRSKLPSYMVPQELTILDEMPLNDNGKVNRQKLANSFRNHPAKQFQIQQPVSEVELVIRKIWGQVLNIEPAVIGPNDSFFQLGGHSIAAMKVVRLGRQAKLKISVAVIFAHPELQSLVKVLS